MRTTIRDIQRLKREGEKIAMVTAYDYTSAQLVDRAGIPLILVGDTLGMVVLGYSTTVPVTMDEMVHHVKAVTRGSQQALIVADMPFLTYSDEEQAVRNAGRLLQEGGAQAVKLEGGTPILPVVRHLVELGIPVMGHLGLTPQAVHQLGGMRVQGRRARAAERILTDAVALQEAGAFALVLELVPIELAAEITRRLRIPTIGIGSGPDTSGQVQVWHDLLGLYTDHVPRHARQFASLAGTITAALTDYAQAVRQGSFPTAEHAASMPSEELAESVRRVDAMGDRRT